MSEIKKNNQNTSLDADSFDDEDDLWALQSDKKDTSLIDIDGFDEDDNLQPLELPVSETKEQTKITQNETIEVEEDTKPTQTIMTESSPSNSLSSQDVTASEENTDRESVSVMETNLEAVNRQPEKPPVKTVEEEIQVISSNTSEDRQLEEKQNIVESKDNDKQLISSSDNMESQPELLDVKNIDSTTDLPSDNKFVNSSNQNESPPQFVTAEKEVSENLNLLVKNSLKELEEKRDNLEITIAKLEKRKAKIEREMTKNFAGVSQDLAIKVQGFKDYLVGSLQDLAAAAEQLELAPNNDDSWDEPSNNINSPNLEENRSSSTPGFVEQNFSQEKKEIRRLLDRYRTRPDYYGPSWQLRRTFEPIHAKTVADWFFDRGGRGAVPSMGSRLQNILVGSAIISILSHLYGDRSRILILADTPEKLGEWRRGLQDCLGISRSDFGPSRGVILFETATALAKKGDSIVEQQDLPLVIMDLDDDRVSLSLLKFPLWLAFAPDYSSPSPGYY